MPSSLSLYSVHGIVLSLPCATEVKILANEHRTHKFKVVVGYRSTQNWYVRTVKLFKRLSDAVVWLEGACEFPDPKLGKDRKLRMGKPQTYTLAHALQHGKREDGYHVRLYPFSGGGFFASLHEPKHFTHIETCLPTKEDALRWLRRIRVPKL